MEKKIEVRTFIQIYTCPKCEKPMQWNGVILKDTEKPFPHHCKCSYTEDLSKTYPQTIYETIRPEILPESNIAEEN